MRPSGCYLCNHRYAGSEQRFSTVGFGSVSNQRSSSERKRRDCIAREGPPCLCQINKFESQSAFCGIDRLVFAGFYALAPNVVDALKIIKPETVIRWHRAGFRTYWLWKSRPRGGRPTIPAEIPRLIHEVSTANPLWGAPRIHGELLKLGINVGQTTVVKYMSKRRRPPSQGWKTFLDNHADGIASMDLFVVPTAAR